MESHNDKIQSEVSVGLEPSDANYCCDAWRAFSSSVRPYLHHQLKPQAMTCTRANPKCREEWELHHEKRNDQMN
jgi:IS1 family transposase